MFFTVFYGFLFSNILCFFFNSFKTLSWLLFYIFNINEDFTHLSACVCVVFMMAFVGSQSVSVFEFYYFFFFCALVLAYFSWIWSSATNKCDYFSSNKFMATEAYEYSYFLANNYQSPILMHTEYSNKFGCVFVCVCVTHVQVILIWICGIQILDNTVTKTNAKKKIVGWQLLFILSPTAEW